MQIILERESPVHDGPISTSATVESWLIRDGQSLTAGRNASESDIVLTDDEAVSRNHFRITCEDGVCLLTDLDSRHGTFVNGIAIAEQSLNDGDVVSTGDIRFRAHLMPNAASEPPKPNAGSPKRRRIVLKMQWQQPADGSGPSSGWMSTILDSDESITLGRMAEQCDIGFRSDSLMSGQHLKIELLGIQCRAIDLKSTNGSLLNGLPFSNELIQSGDEIRIGNTFIIVGERIVGSAKYFATVGDVRDSRGKRKGKRISNRGFRIVNDTPFQCAPVTGRINYPGHSISLVVKGTFQLTPDGPLLAADEQQLLTDSLPFPDSDDPQAAPRYESDFAFFKPCTDVLVAGHCHAPGAKPVQRLRPSIQVGNLSHSLDVFGRRHWKTDGHHWTPSEPEPFTSLELNLKHAFGGPHIEENPSGTGASTKAERRSGDSLPLPQVLNAGDTISHPNDVVTAAGFGALSRWHARRKELMGTFDQDWENNRWPWFPVDFKWAHYNAAPRELQSDGYLEGNEDVVLTHLHPKHQQLRTRLPGIRVRAFVNPSGQPFREVPMQLDTLWMDTDSDEAILLWRGYTEVASEECEDVRQVYFVTEALNEAPHSVDHYHAQLINALQSSHEEFDPPPESPPEEEEGAEAAEIPGVDLPEGIAAVDPEILDIRAQVEELQKATGEDPALLERQVQAEIERLEVAWGLNGDVVPDDIEDRINMDIWNNLKQLHDGQVAAGVEPIDLPPQPVPVPKATTDDAAADDAAIDAATADDGWTREAVIRHHAEGKSFAGLYLSGLDLSGLELSGADFHTAIVEKSKLTDCQLIDCNFELAVLSGCDMTAANLSGSTLDHSDFHGTILHNAVLDNCSLTRTEFSEAWLTNASLKRAKATGARFSATDLSRCDLTEATLDRADFSDARLTAASLIRCSLKEATLQGASAREARFDFADLTKVRAAEADCVLAVFHQAQAPESVWDRAILIGADLTWVRFGRANLTKSVLKDARLTGADLRGACLSKAVLRRALLTDANLFEANLAQADFRYTDLSRASLYGAEVFETLWDEAMTDAVNWKMTKMCSTEDAS